ncbi:MAG TPA: 5-oxoprolinase subunit PxpB [Rhodanobacteraceae bacterium]|jgi:KipI family sensor histidine kinase inhibitor|nr:5-oxoprolinase subunit PxpB [Rhodanobacteraceae bacterium]
MSSPRRTDAPFAIEPLGESALLLRFGQGLDAATNTRVHAASATLQSAQLPGIVDLVPAYATLALHFDPLAWTDAHGGAVQAVAAAVRAVLDAPPEVSSQDSTRIEIPVCYGGDEGPDLETLANHAKLDADEVVARHAAAGYRVAMIGFAPGFPYLIGLDSALAMPRRATPRTRVPAGSVAIGGVQTGIYPSELPGGWQLIGRTPLRLFDPRRDPPSLLVPGDRVRFVPIGHDEFVELAHA